MTKRGLGLLFVAPMLALAISTAQSGPLWVTGGGGVSVPIGDYADATKSVGYLIGGSIDYGVAEFLMIGIDGTWNSNGGDLVGASFGGIVLTKDKFRILQAAGHLRLVLPLGMLKPFGVVGVGIHNVKWSVTFEDIITGETFTEKDFGFQQIGTRPGARIGMGAMLQLTNQIGLSGEADYHYVHLESGSIQYASVRAGMMINLMP